MSPSHKPTQLYTVQALRGIAALMVLIFHTAGIQKEELDANLTAEFARLTGIWDQGFAGVDLFFVISGFIMVYVTQDYQRRAAENIRFLYARASRVYPLWWVYLALMMLYFLATYGQVTAPNRGTALSEILPHAIMSIFLIPQYAEPVLVVGWTLVHEMMFYVVFTGLLFLPRKWLPAALMVWAILVGAALWTLGVPPRATNFISLIFSPLSLEFIMGSLAAFLVLKTKGAGALLAGLLGAGLLAAALIIGIDPKAPGLVLTRVWFYGIPFAVLVYGVVGLERAGKLRSPAGLSRLGDWSYSLYLSHVLVLLTLRRLWQMAGGALPESLRFNADGPWDNILFGVIAVAAAVIFSAVSYRFIERSLLRLFRRWRRAKERSAAAS